MLFLLIVSHHWRLELSPFMSLDFTRHYWKRTQPSTPSSFWRMSLSRFVTYIFPFVSFKFQHLLKGISLEFDLYLAPQQFCIFFFSAPDSHLGVHVCWWGECGSGSAPPVPQDCRETQGTLSTCWHCSFWQESLIVCLFQTITMLSLFYFWILGEGISWGTPVCQEWVKRRFQEKPELQ